MFADGCYIFRNDNAEALSKVHYPDENIKQDSYYTTAPEIGKSNPQTTGTVFSGGNIYSVLIIALGIVVIIETLMLVVAKNKK